MNGVRMAQADQNIAITLCSPLVEKTQNVCPLWLARL